MDCRCCNYDIPALCWSKARQCHYKSGNILQVDTVSLNDNGHVDVTAALILQPDMFAHSSVPPLPPAEPGLEQQQAQSQSVPTAAQQHAGSVQVLMDHLLDSQQARWQDEDITQADRSVGNKLHGACFMLSAVLVWALMVCAVRADCA